MREIREFSESESEFKLLEQGEVEAHAISFPKPPVWDVEERISYLLSGDRRISFYYEDNTPIAYIVFATCSYQSNLAVEVISIFVRSVHRRKGIAKKMLSHLKNEISNLAAIVLSVSVSNVPAVSLYESAGFEVVRHRMALSVKDPVNDT